jgi:hypothetical protein
MEATPLLRGTLQPSGDDPLTQGAAATRDPGDRTARPSLFDGEPAFGGGNESQRLDGDLNASGSLGNELSSLEVQLDAVRADLDQQRALAAERAARCSELELAAARDRRAAEHEIEYTTSNLVRAHSIAVADRDRAVAQHEEAVSSREAAVRTRQRMEALRDEAIAERDAAQARRDEAIAQRDEARRQRDELRSAHRALQKQLKSATAHVTPKRAAPPQPADADGSRPSDQPTAAAPNDDPVAPALHTAPRLRGSPHPGNGLTDADLWGIRILGTIGAVCFITLVVFIMKAVVGL